MKSDHDEICREETCAVPPFLLARLIKRVRDGFRQSCCDLSGERSCW